MILQRAMKEQWNVNAYPTLRWSTGEIQRHRTEEAMTLGESRLDKTTDAIS
jgi:hypothetical protein